MKAPLRIAALGVTLGIAVLSVHLVDQVFFAPKIFEGTMGLLALYAETAAIGVGIAGVRSLERARRALPDVSRRSPGAARVLHMPPARAGLALSPSVDTAVENWRNSAAS
jgi:hypothetical protein